MHDIVKICLVHGSLIADHAHKENNKSKKGYVLRCNQCKLEKDRRWKEANREKHNASSGRARKIARKLYREGLVTEESKANKWAKQDRRDDPQKYKKYQENYVRKHGIKKVRRYEVLRIHGLSSDQHNKMIISQNNKCAICFKEETRLGRSGDITPLCVDHCHKTQKIRGLLCHCCNTAIGKLKDNISLLESAIEYLKKHQSQ